MTCRVPIAIPSVLTLLLLACPAGDDGAQDTEGTGSSSGSGSTIPGATMTAPGDDGMMTMGGESTTGDPSGGSTSPDDTSVGPADSSSGGPSDESSGDQGSSGGSSTGAGSTGDGVLEYPPCQIGADPVCEDPYMGCYEFVPNYNMCLHPCQQASDCPASPGGDAAVVCANFSGGQCVLDCAGGATCPAGMSCQSPAVGVFRCLWSSL